MFRNDQPIESVDEDVLGRKGLAVALARNILSWNGSGSLVVGIHGPWGDGKTSLKNMVVEQLSKGQENPPVVLNFNPWFQSGEGHVAGSFFRLVGEKLREEGLSNDPEASAKRWDSYARYFEISSRFAAAIDFCAPFFGMPPGQGAISSGALHPAAEAARIAAASLHSASSQSFETLRDQLTEDFTKLKKKLLVVVDDMDRLTEEEIRIVFRLIKAVGEFPNTIYLPLFQKSTVEKALNPISGGEGQEFLKKIVQVDVPVPVATSRQLADFVVTGLKNIFGGSFESAINIGRLSEYWTGGMSSWIRNLRDVTRFMNSYEFMVNGLRTEDSLEVDMVDLMVVEALRIFEPKAHELISSSKLSLVERVSSQASVELTELAGNLLESKGSRLSKGQFQEVLATLFPVFRAAWDIFNYSSGISPVRDKLVCSEEFFDRYFGFGLAEGLLSETTIDRLKFAKSDPDEIKRVLSEFEERGILFEVLKRMKDEDEIFEDPSLAYPIALMNACDRWKDVPSAQLLDYSGPAYHYALHAADRAVRKRRKRDDRENALQKLITDSSGLVATCVLLDDLIEKHHKFDVEKPEENRIAELKGLWLSRVTQAAADSSLAEVENMERVLRSWKKWGNPDDVQKWRNDLTAFPEGILRLLKSYISQSSTSYGDGRHKSICWISWQNLEQIAELQVWEGYNDALSGNESEIRGKDTAKLLRESLQRWSNQSPDKTSSHLDDEEDDD